MPSLTYPAAPRVEQVDDFHGTPIADPYRPLEDTDAPESRRWIEAENELTEAFLAAVPARRAIRDRLTELWNYPRAGAPWNGSTAISSRICRSPSRSFHTRWRIHGSLG